MRRSFAIAVAACIAWPLGARAATAIDGGDVGGQVWTPAGNPYVIRKVNGGLTVPIGQELRIEAGTEVLFSQSHGQVDLAVRLEGKLTISGTAAAPVILRGEEGGTAVEWMGIFPEATAVIRISNAVIRNAGAGIILRTPDARIDRTTFENCGGGLRVHSGTHAFDSIIARNNTLGVEVLGGEPPYPSLSLTNALVQGNTTGFIAKNGTTLTIINSTIDSNSTALIGYTRPGPTIDVQNTILSNNPTAVLFDEVPGLSTPPVVIVTHSTFWANTRNVVRGVSSSTGTVITAGDVAPPGAGNAVADPRYVSATDLHLTAGSPCIDSGIPARAPDHDLGQNARPQGVMFDRGAYEFGTGGGAAGTGGGAGGAAGTGGASGAAGTGGGAAGTGGVSGATGAASSAGTAGGGSAGVGGATSVSGSAGTGGSAGIGGTGVGGASAGGAAAGGASGTAGSGASGGTSGGGGGRGGMGGTGGRAGGGAGGTTDDDDGCGCGVGGTDGGGAGLAFVALGFLLVRRRRPATRSAHAASR